MNTDSTQMEPLTYDAAIEAVTARIGEEVGVRMSGSRPWASFDGTLKGVRHDGEYHYVDLTTTGFVTLMRSASDGGWQWTVEGSSGVMVVVQQGDIEIAFQFPPAPVE